MKGRHKNVEIVDASLKHYNVGRDYGYNAYLYGGQ